MLSTIYEIQKRRRAELIKKLFEDIAQETIDPENIHRIRLTILYTQDGYNFCRRHVSNSNFTIGIELYAIKKRTLKGYSNGYYPGRKLKIDKYILHNRHNAIRFVLYHELKHAKDFIENRIEREDIEELKADEWAIKHLKGVK